MKELYLDSAIDDRFPAFGEPVQSRRRVAKLPRDWRLFSAFCIWAGFISMLYFVLSFSHEDAAAKTQADSVLCKRQ